MGSLDKYLGSGSGIALLAGILFLVLMTNACHEAAHALSAWWSGDKRASIRARCTLNPIKHAHWFLTFVLPIAFLWLTNGAALVGGAKPVMVMPDRVGRLGMIFVALSGPFANALFGGLLVAVLGLLIHFELFGLSDVDWVRSKAWALLYFPLWFSFVLTLVNLLPLPGVDGGHVVAALLPGKARAIWYRLTPLGFLALLTLFLWHSGLLARWGIGEPPEGPNFFDLVQARVTSYVEAMVHFYGQVL